MSWPQGKGDAIQCQLSSAALDQVPRPVSTSTYGPAYPRAQPTLAGVKIGFRILSSRVKRAQHGSTH